MTYRRKIIGILGVTSLAVGTLAAVSPTSALAAGRPATCTGGSIARGTYSSLAIAGACNLDSGSVVVQHSLTVLPGAALNAAFGGSNLTVGQNLDVQSNAILVLGCEPQAFQCFNDPDPNGGTLSTNDSVGRNLTAHNALMVLAHHNSIHGNVTQSGGGGGVNCSHFPLGPNGPPAYSTYEDNSVGNNAAITGVQTCWLGFIRNTVSKNVNFNDNVTADPDGNEVVSNTVGRNLNCSGNSPAPQFGDAGNSLNIVSRHANGQCASLV